jgi:hypothetical protein
MAPSTTTTIIPHQSSSRLQRPCSGARLVTLLYENRRVLRARSSSTPDSERICNPTSAFSN